METQVFIKNDGVTILRLINNVKTEIEGYDEYNLTKHLNKDEDSNVIDEDSNVIEYNPRLPSFYIKKTKDPKYTTPESHLNEFNILSNLEHPNIIKTYGYHYIDKGILLDYVKGVDMYEYLQIEPLLTEYKIYKIFKQIILAVHHCHEKNIVHRDIKLENIMIEHNGNIILLDFEYSCLMKSKEDRMSVENISGTVDYFPPELLQYIKSITKDGIKKYSLINEVQGHTYNPFKLDMWSLGIILYELIFHCTPEITMKKNLNIDENHNTIYAMNINDSKFCYWNGKKNSELKTLIKGLLAINPNDRYDTQDVLNSDWMQKFNKIDKKTNKNIFNSVKETVILIKNNNYYEIDYTILRDRNITYNYLFATSEHSIEKLIQNNSRFKRSCTIS